MSDVLDIIIGVLAFLWILRLIKNHREKSGTVIPNVSNGPAPRVNTQSAAERTQLNRQPSGQRTQPNRQSADQRAKPNRQPGGQRTQPNRQSADQRAKPNRQPGGQRTEANRQPSGQRTEANRQPGGQRAQANRQSSDQRVKPNRQPGGQGVQANRRSTEMRDQSHGQTGQSMNWEIRNDKPEILMRAAENNRKWQEDRTLEELEEAHLHSERSESLSEGSDRAQEFETASLLGELSDLMVKGYDGGLSSRRDFLGEAMDMINSFQSL